MMNSALFQSLRPLCVDEAAFQRLQQILQQASFDAARYLAIIDNQAELICHYRPDSIVIFVNEAYLQYMGKRQRDVIGESFFKYLSPEQTQFAQKHIEQLIVEKRRITHEMCLQDGPMAGSWIQWADTPILSPKGEVLEIQAVGRDISPRKEMELALEAREAQLNLVLDSVQNILLAVFDHNLRYTLLRGKLLKTLGEDTENFLGQGLLDKMPHHVHETIRRHCEAVLKGEMREMEYQAANRYFHLRSYPLQTEAGIIGGVSMISDITDHKHQERREFELAVERQRLEILNQFVRDAAHEFYTPIASIETSLHIAENSQDEERRHRAYEKIRAQAKRLTSLVDSMTTMMRLSNTSNSSRAATSLEYIFKEIIESSQKAILQKQVQLDLKIAENLPRYIGVANDLHTAFKHLLDNAIRYSHSHGLISIQLEAIEKAIIIRIQDNGEGIPAEDLEHIFELFYRRDIAHTTPGLGLGLSIARAIIEEQHEGKISIESQIGQGTTVLVSLPIFF